MRRILKWGAIGIAGAAGIVVLAGASAWGVSEIRFRKDWNVQPEPVPVSTDSATRARGAHLAVIRGCVDCHGEDLGGAVMIDALPMFGRLVAPNLTPGGRASNFTSIDWVRAIRHGVGPAGRPLLYMPAQEFYVMSDADLGALIAYLERVPAVRRELPGTVVGPLARLLFLRGDLPLVPAELVDHQGPRPEAPAEGPTPEFGRYLATGCINCHGEGYSGGPVPGTPPDFAPAANITMHESGIAHWSEEDFFRALREGKRPDGSAIDPFMPSQITAKMTDTEIRAIWAFLKAQPPRPYGSR